MYSCKNHLYVCLKDVFKNVILLFQITKFNTETVKTLDEPAYDKINGVVKKINSRIETANNRKSMVLRWLGGMNYSVLPPPVTQPSSNSTAVTSKHGNETTHAPPTGNKGVICTYNIVFIVLIIFSRFL